MKTLLLASGLHMTFSVRWQTFEGTSSEYSSSIRASFVFP